jgi:outer membrane protein assembly factor BamE (lipoprotein component of BamABCDE complex)
MEGGIMRLKPFLAALLVAAVMPAASALADEGSKTLYAQANFFINKGWISSINYRVGTLMPIGTKVELVSLKGSEAVLKVLESGATVKFVNHKATGKPTDEIFKTFFGPDNPAKLLLGLTPEEQEHVKAAEIALGMSREAVLFSLGPPPPQETPSFESETWTYWRQRFASTQFKVHFDEDGKVDSVTNLPGFDAAAPAKPDEKKSDSWFAVCNVHHEKGVVSWANYIRGPILEVNTEVEVISKKSDTVTFKVVETGQNLVFKNAKKKSGADTWTLFTRLFEQKDQAPKLAKLSKSDKIRVMGAEVGAGMSKKAVEAAWCPPPPHATAAFESDTWTYWRGTHNKVKVVFDDKGKVKDMIE